MMERKIEEKDIEEMCGTDEEGVVPTSEYEGKEKRHIAIQTKTSNLLDFFSAYSGRTMSEVVDTAIRDSIKNGRFKEEFDEFKREFLSEFIEDEEVESMESERTSIQ